MPSIRTVVVCEAQVPFVHGGAEVHVRELLRELTARGYDTELVRFGLILADLPLSDQLGDWNFDANDGIHEAFREVLRRVRHLPR